MVGVGAGAVVYGGRTGNAVVMGVGGLLIYEGLMNTRKAVENGAANPFPDTSDSGSREPSRAPANENSPPSNNGLCRP